MSESEADKKRNKLGYQRISVACAHCRRRKIRCVMAEADPHNRCQNCIRLNKECIFHPVEQQQGSSESGSVAGQPISHSPRDIASGQAFEARPNSYTRLAPLLSITPQPFAGMPYDSHSSQSTPHSSAIDYRSQQFNEGRWPVAEGIGVPLPSQPHAPVGESVESSHGLYWSPGNEEYGALGDPNRTLTPDTRSYSFPSGIPPEQQWQMLQQQQQQPGRSVSFGTYEGQAHFQPQHSMTGAAIQQSVAHHSTFPMDAHGASSMRGPSGPQSASVSGGETGPGYQQTSQQYAYQNPQFHNQHDMSGSWLSSHEQHGYGEYEPHDPADGSRQGQ